MPRPKLLKDSTKLNLTVERRTKRALFKLATDAGVSISELLRRWTDEKAEALKMKEAA